MKSVFNHLWKKWNVLADSPHELCLLSPATHSSVYAHTCDQETVSEFCQSADELVVVEYVWENYTTDVELDGEVGYSERHSKRCADTSLLSAASVSFESTCENSLCEERELNISLPPPVYLS